MSSEFLPEGFWYDNQQRVSRSCPRCQRDTYAPGSSGWASRYWKHSETDEYACL